jgi:CP family cyanate transporter-like MFS transporter
MPRNVIFFALLIGVAMWAPVYCVAPMEPLIKEHLLLTHTQTSLLLSAPALMLVLTAIPAGLVSDRVGIKKTIGLGLIVMAVGAALRGTATDFTSLLAYTFIYGFGFGWTFPNLPKLVSIYVSKDKANVAMGVVNSGFPVGTALGLAITVPVILPIAGTYQGVFLIWSIPAMIAAVSWWILIRQPDSKPIHIGQRRTSITSFRRAFANKHLWLVTVLMFITTFVMWNWNGWAPVMMMLKGASPSLAGLIASMTIWAILPTFLLVPRISHRIGLRKPFLWVPSIILAIAFWGARYMTINTSWFLMALVGVAGGTRFTTLMALPLELTHENEVGMASGMLLSVGYLGGVIGPLIGGRVLDITQNLNISLLVLTIMSVSATFIALKVPEIGPGRRTLIRG